MYSVVVSWQDGLWSLGFEALLDLAMALSHPAMEAAILRTMKVMKETGLARKWLWEILILIMSSYYNELTWNPRWLHSVQFEVQKIFSVTGNVQSVTRLSQRALAKLRVAGWCFKAEVNNSNFLWGQRHSNWAVSCYIMLSSSSVPRFI